MAIDGLIGRPGSGKSYELTRRVLHAADRDRLVFTNFAVAHENVYYFTPDQLLDLPPALVVIDEAHLWFPARMSLKLPMSWLGGMSQTRKKGWDMLWAAQHEGRVDKAIRDVTSWMHLCRSWGSYDNHPLLFSHTTWEPEEFRRAGKQWGRGFHLFDSRVAAAYDTHQTLEQADHTVQENDAYAKRRRGGSVLEGTI